MSDRQLKVTFLSTWPPKPCGIATFTHDLTKGLLLLDRLVDYRVIAINDPYDDFRYEWLVRAQIEKESLDSLRRTAEYINYSGCDVVNLQHEFGIWGGFDGEFLLPFLDLIQKPVVATFHSVPLTHSSFNRANRVRLIQEIGKRVDRAITFVPDAGRFLVEHCGLPAERVDVIWHGAPEFPEGGRAEARATLGLDNDLVVSTFGLLTRFKGLDLAIKALPALCARHPNLRYLLLGRPHPAEGDGFLEGLQRLAADLGVAEHVRFVSHFLSEEEIGAYLKATDVYLTPYLDETQISSGTLTYALAAGCCCVTTDYVYARNALAEGRGVVVARGSSDALRDGLAPVLDDPALRAAYAARAREFGRGLSWRAAADQFLDSLYRAVDAPRAARNAAATPSAP